MPRQCQGQLVGRDSGAIVAHDDPSRATALDIDRHVSGTGVETVFQQFFQDRRRAFDDFAGSNLVDECLRQLADWHAG